MFVFFLLSKIISIFVLFFLTYSVYGFTLVMYSSSSNTKKKENKISAIVSHYWRNLHNYRNKNCSLQKDFTYKKYNIIYKYTIKSIQMNN